MEVEKKSLRRSPSEKRMDREAQAQDNAPAAESASDRTAEKSAGKEANSHVQSKQVHLFIPDFPHPPLFFIGKMEHPPSDQKQYSNFSWPWLVDSFPGCYYIVC